MNQIKNITMEKKSISFSGFFGESIANSSLALTVLRNNVESYTQIINPELSLLYLYRAIMFLKSLIHLQKIPLCVLFLNANPEFDPLIKLASKGQHVVYSKWVGGTLTNWRQISRSIRTFQAFEWKWKSMLKQKSFLFSQLEKMKKRYGGFENPFKKEASQKYDGFSNRLFMNLVFGKVKLWQSSFRNKLKTVGLKKNLNFKWQNEKKPKIEIPLRKPQVLIVLDTYAHRAAIEEAIKRNIPIIGFVNTDTETKGISYPIPGNNQNYFFVHFCLNFIAMALQSENFKMKKL
jgi:ribosomal protein S2